MARPRRAGSRRAASPRPGRARPAGAAAGEARRPRLARRRRAPEEARLELLDAAERVFGRAQPDQVGLKEVAREAGVSHALITHYFGTYAGLIEATFDRRVRTLRARVLGQLREAGAVERPLELLRLLFDALEDPVHRRLTAWLMASERPAAIHALALQERGICEVARQIAAEVAPGLAPADAARVAGRLELAVLTAVAAAYGYAMTKPALVGAIGREVSPALDEDVRATLARMLLAYLRDVLAG